MDAGAKPQHYAILNTILQNILKKQPFVTEGLFYVEKGRKITYKKSPILLGNILQFYYGF